MAQPLTPKKLTVLGKTKHGKKWHEIVAVSLGVHRTTVVRWANGKRKMTPLAERALIQHFGI